MKTNINNGLPTDGVTLVLGGTGKTGRRVAEKLAARGIPVRAASRTANPGFDWDDSSSWNAVLDGVQRALRREPADFAEFARRIASSGVWDAATADDEEAAA